MEPIVFLNGDYLPASAAKISIFDRSVNFGDAIYEVAGVLDAKLIDFEPHMQRYASSLNKLELVSPLDQQQILAVFRQLIERNQLDEGLLYLQLTRGAAERDFVWPAEIKPNLFIFTQAKPALENRAADNGVSLASTDDLRWARRDIKSVNLLGQVLAKKIARDAGAYEALLIDCNGFITECASSSFYLVAGERILTRPLSHDILPGVTRRALVELCAQHGLELVETRFRLEDALRADEAFITGASSYVLPVVEIDGHNIGNGTPGALTQKLRAIYIDYARASLL